MTDRKRIGGCGVKRHALMRESGEDETRHPKPEPSPRL